MVLDILAKEIDRKFETRAKQQIIAEQQKPVVQVTGPEFHVFTEQGQVRRNIVPRTF